MQKHIISESLKNKRNRLAVLRAVTASAVIVLILLNVLFGFVSGKINLKIDLTKDSVLKLSDTTKTALKNLDTEVNVYSLVPENESDTTVKQMCEILEKYAKLSSKIKYQSVDIYSNPAFSEKYIQKGENINQYSIVFETDKRYKIVNLTDAVNYNSTDNSIQSIKAEQLFTGAVVYVTDDTDINIAISEGHGETASEKYFEQLFADNGYNVSAVNLITSDIPDNINMLIVTTPETDFGTDETQKIDEFLQKGKSAQFMIDPSINDYPNLYSYLKSWGVEFTDGFMIEKDSASYIQNPMNIIPEVENCDITKNIYNGKLTVITPAMKGIKPCTHDSVIEQVILKTSDKALCKVNLNSQTADKENGDIEGSQNLAVMYTKQFDSKNSAKLFVTGGTSLIASSFMQAPYANSDLYMNIVSYLTNNDKAVNIAAKNVSTEYIAVSAKAALILACVTIVVIPVILIAAGIIIWIKRRHL